MPSSGSTVRNPGVGPNAEPLAASTAAARCPPPHSPVVALGTRIGGTAVGTAVMTGGGKLRAKHVIHAVGPKMGEGDEDKKLSSAVRACLALADRHGLKSIAMPAISTGAFGFPIDRAARIILTEIQRYLQGGTKLLRVVVVLYGEDAWKIFAREMRRGFR